MRLSITPQCSVIGAAILFIYLLSTAPSGSATSSASNGKQTGKTIFVNNCSSCHILKAAGATGVVGPNLDKLKLPKSIVIAQIKHGGGVMPAFAHTMTSTQIATVAQFIYEATHPDKKQT